MKFLDKENLDNKEIFKLSEKEIRTKKFNFK